MEYAEDLKKKLEVDDKARGYAEVASAAGVSTPHNLLHMIYEEARKSRMLQEQQCAMMSEMIEMMKQQSLDSKGYSEAIVKRLELQLSVSSDMHKSKESKSMMNKIRAEPVYSSAPKTSASSLYWFESEKISTGAGLIGVCLMRLIGVVYDTVIKVEHPQIPNDFPLDYKHFRSAVDNICKGNIVIILPKPSSIDFKQAASSVGSYVEASTSRLTREQFAEIMNTHTSVMAVAEEVRKRLIRTKGVLGPLQQVCLSMVVYPYVSADGLVRDPDFDVLASVPTLRSVKSRMGALPASAINKYLRYISDGATHFNALRAAQTQSTDSDKAT